MVVVFGSINADLVARVVHLPREGETQTAIDYAVHAGGKGANQALAARRAGSQVVLAGTVGRDGFAEVALGTLREAGIDLSHVVTTPRATGIALIHVDAHGRNTITVVSGANAEARSAQVGDAVLDDRAVVLLQLEVPIDEVTAVARRARARGARVILNAAPPSPLPPASIDTVDVLVANEHEAAVLAGALGLPIPPEAFCGAAADRWRMTAIVTLGAHGLVAADANHRYRLPAAVVEVVDTTAAGDAFAGALAAAMDRGATMVDALAEGIAAGSHACTRHGAQPSIGMRDRWKDAARVVAATARVESR